MHIRADVPPGYLGVKGRKGVSLPSLALITDHSGFPEELEKCACRYIERIGRLNLLLLCICVLELSQYNSKRKGWNGRQMCIRTSSEEMESRLEPFVNAQSGTSLATVWSGGGVGGNYWAHFGGVLPAA